MKKVIAVLFALALGVEGVGLSPAEAQQQCADRALVIEHLADTYGESRQSIGLGTNNSVIEVFASEETGTWTITVTNPSGLTCLVASGQAFEDVSDEITPMKATPIKDTQTQPPDTASVTFREDVVRYSFHEHVPTSDGSGYISLYIVHEGPCVSTVGESMEEGMVFLGQGYHQHPETGVPGTTLTFGLGFTEGAGFIYAERWYVEEEQGCLRVIANRHEGPMPEEESEEPL